MAFFLLKYLLFICLYELLYIYLSYTITKLNIMTTREEYNKALDILEAYHKQLFIGGVGSSLRDNGKTKVNDWKQIKTCSYRLRQGLKEYSNWKDSKNEQLFIEDLKPREFAKIRNLGRKSWLEFVELRGY